VIGESAGDEDPVAGRFDRHTWIDDDGGGEDGTVERVNVRRRRKAEDGRTAVEDERAVRTGTEESFRTGTR
jgi:hypothetical protein